MAPIKEPPSGRRINPLRSHDPEVLRAFVDRRLPEVQETWRRIRGYYSETGTFLLTDLEESMQGYADVVGGMLRRIALMFPEDSREFPMKMSAPRWPAEHRPEAFKAPFVDDASEALIVVQSGVPMREPTWMQ